MNTSNMKAYQAASYAKNRRRLAKKDFGTGVCVRCNERAARKNRRYCSRCEKRASTDRRTIVPTRPRNLVPTGQKIHDVKKILIEPDGTVKRIPRDFLSRHFLSTSPGDSRWLIVWRPANSIKSAAA